jgi:octaprenyl-diphosphate synthase
MSSVDKIKAPIASEMKTFEKEFRSTMKTKVPLLNIITNYILRRNGKQMRPMFVFLSAKLNGEINYSTYSAASLIELMHTATLIHDDVVDEAYQRRGFFSINALWKNKIAVLVGDYLLSRGLLLAVNNKEFKLLEIVSEAVKEMSEGELLQIEKSKKLDITEEVYFDIIRKKTATLIAACAASGASSVNAEDEKIEKMKLFGEHIGIAFQIKDDLFDYQKTATIGKPTGNDIKEKKLTLPLIYTLQNSSKSEINWALKIIKKHNNDKTKVDELIKFVNNQGGIAYTEKVMYEYRDKALKVLEEFPDNEARASLKEFVLYTTSRKK